MIPGLLVTEGPKRGIYIHLPEATPFWLGRLPEADFMLEEDTKVSGKHCFFLRQGSPFRTDGRKSKWNPSQWQ
jgi:hypothetical protein